MSDTPYDLKDALAELATAMKPLELIAESLRGLDRSQHLQAELNLIEHCYPESVRKGIYAQLDDAYAAQAVADETLILRNKRQSDQRSQEQYAAVHGPEKARKAFLSDDEFKDMCDKAKQVTNDLRNAHPVLYRVHARTKGSF